MATVSKKLLLFFILLCSIASAQKPQALKTQIDTSGKNQLIKKSKWEGGLSIGATAYSGDLEFAVQASRPIVGLFLRREIGNYFALNAHVSQGLLAGSDAYSTKTPWRVSRNIQFKSSLTELTLRGELHFLGYARKVKNVGSVMSDTVVETFKWRLRSISPFMYVGGGMMLMNPKTDFNDKSKPNPITEAPRIAADKAAVFDKMLPIAPFGGGLRIPLINRNANLTIEGGFRPTFSDYLDGMSIAGNPLVNDWYFVGNIGYSKLFGNKKDSDGDGIADKNDLCPFLKGEVKFKGCPDRDGDGIVDDKDECPTVAGLALYEGCPDTDKDGIIDKFDDCPTVAGLGQFNGCLAEKVKRDSTGRIISLGLDTIKTMAENDINALKPIEITKLNGQNDSLSLRDNISIPPQYIAIKTQKTDENIQKEVTTIEPEPEPQTVVSKPTTPVNTTIINNEKTVIEPQKTVSPTVSEQVQTTQIVVAKPTISIDSIVINKEKTVIEPQKTVSPTVSEQVPTTQIVVSKPTISIDSIVINKEKTVIEPQEIVSPTVSEQVPTSQIVVSKPTISIDSIVINKEKTVGEPQKTVSPTVSEQVPTSQIVVSKPTISIDSIVINKEKTVGEPQKTVSPTVSEQVPTTQIVVTKPTISIDSIIINKEKTVIEPQKTLTPTVLEQVPTTQIVVTKPTISIDSIVINKEKTVGEPQKTVTPTVSEQVPSTQIVVSKPATAIDTPPQYVSEKTSESDTTNAFNIVRNHYSISPVYFDTKKSLYKPESFVILDELAYILLANPTYTLVIKGHTDTTGTLISNQVLSLKRAKSCYNYLIGKGVPSNRMSFKGFGPLQPVTGNNSEEQRQLNRRVEFELNTD